MQSTILQWKLSANLGIWYRYALLACSYPSVKTKYLWLVNIHLQTGTFSNPSVMLLPGTSGRQSLTFYWISIMIAWKKSLLYELLTILKRAVWPSKAEQKQLHYAHSTLQVSFNNLSFYHKSLEFLLWDMNVRQCHHHYFQKAMFCF